MIFHRTATFLLASALFVSCANANTTTFSSPIVLIGSTPGDNVVKTMLGIDSQTAVDFVRWNLSLNPSDKHSFILNIHFGEGQPNTSGFKGGGEQLSFHGTYAVMKNKNSEVYQLKSEKMPAVISLARLNENLFHLLSPDNKLMVGNAGWSYTMSQKDPAPNVSDALSSSSTSLGAAADKPEVFEGRTPCSEIVKEYNFEVGNDCMKLKWRITLHRDSSNRPVAYNTYSIDSTLDRQTKTEGKWTIIRGTKTNPDAIIYQLDRGKKGGSIYLLVGDENVLFFLDKEHRLLTGNGHFSYTLNRRTVG